MNGYGRGRWQRGLAGALLLAPLALTGACYKASFQTFDLVHDELKRLSDRAGIWPREGLRAKEPLAQELGLTRADVTDDEVLDAMIAHPILINRPIVETEKGDRLCRPQDMVREIL